MKDYNEVTKNYISQLEIRNLDEWKDESLSQNKGFIVNISPDIKSKDIVREDIDSVFSHKFGATLKDQNMFGNAYRCNCGKLYGKVKNGETCEQCRSKVEYIGEDFSYFGWIVLNNHKFIHPQMYIFIESLIGKDKLNDIIEPLSDDIDSDGMKKRKLSKSFSKSNNNPFLGIGITEFINKFDEILDYFFRKSSKVNKQHIYQFLKYYKNLIFTSSYPVFTTQLRPIRIDNGEFQFAGINEYFVSLSKTGAKLNSSTIMYQNHQKDKLLYKFQMLVNTIYVEVRDKNLPDKYGAVRKTIGGRCNLTSRNVIIPNSKLKVDECIISYFSAVKVLEQFIINILFKFHHPSLNDARVRWEKACAVKDPLIEKIIRDLIVNHKTGRGFPILMNRNPTIDYGGIMQMYVIDITDSYALEIPLIICKIMGADFDGDKHNVLWSVMDELTESAEDLINPRNNMFISKNDGKFNRAMSQTTDIIVNLNSLHDMYLSYSDEEIQRNLQVVERSLNKYKVSQ